MYPVFIFFRGIPERGPRQESLRYPNLLRTRTNGYVELGMSMAVFWNFLGTLRLSIIKLLAYKSTGAGFLALFVPFGINWGHGKLLGLFS